MNSKGSSSVSLCAMFDPITEIHAFFFTTVRHPVNSRTQKSSRNRLSAEKYQTSKEREGRTTKSNMGKRSCLAFI